MIAADPTEDPTEDPTTDGPLAGRTIAITAERRNRDQEKLFRTRGAQVVNVPTMHTVDLTDDAGLRATTDGVIATPPTWTLATTGFGMRLWFEAADSWGEGEALIAALASSKVVARGPKAQSACRQRGLSVEWTAPDESMPEVVDWMSAQPGIDAASVVLQLFDADDHPSTVRLRAIADSVVDVPIYRWRRPDDTAAVVGLARQIADRTVDAVTFTSQPAIRFLAEIAAEAGLAEAMVDAFNDGSVLPVCVGPVCAEAAVAAGVTTSVWPEPYRLVPMVTLASRLLAAP